MICQPTSCQPKSSALLIDVNALNCRFNLGTSKEFECWSGTCTDRPQVVLKHQPLCPGWEKVPFFSWAQFFFSFINIFRIQISFSVINFPKCVLISEGLFIWVLVRISPRHAPRHRRRIRILCLCSRVLTSPRRASPSSSPTSVLSARPHRCRLRLHWPAASD